jgi:hypothetical protein
LVQFGFRLVQDRLSVASNKRVIEFGSYIDISFQHIFVDRHRENMPSVFGFFGCKGRMNPFLAKPLFQFLIAVICWLLARLSDSNLRLVGSIAEAQLINDCQKKFPEKGETRIHKFIEFKLRLKNSLQTLVELSHRSESLLFGGHRPDIAGAELEVLEYVKSNEEEFFSPDVVDVADSLGELNVVLDRGDQHVVRFLH